MVRFISDQPISTNDRSWSNVEAASSNIRSATGVHPRSKQVDHLCNKATKMLGYVRRSTLNIKDITVRRRLCLCLVRSQLCYGSQIWAPQSVTLIKRVERLQRRATKYILNLPFRCDTTYNQRLILLDLLPLCYWHEFLAMVTFYKLKHGIMTIVTQ